MKIFETGKSQPSTSYRFDRSREEEGIDQIEHEIAVLKEWIDIQTHLVAYILAASANPVRSWRSVIETSINQCTDGNAEIWWEPLSKESQMDHKDSQIVTVRFQQLKYGILKLTPDYLISHKVSNIPQRFANLCALLLTFAEHQTLVQSLLKSLQPLDICQPLTPRERDVLACMASGQNESATAQQLSIAQTTVRTHRHSTYHRLCVNNPQDAVLRSFAFRLLDWLDFPLREVLDVGFNK